MPESSSNPLVAKKPRPWRLDGELVHFGQPDAKRDFMSHVSRLSEDYRCTMHPGRSGITDPQRKYYFAVIVYYFAAFIREHDPALTESEAKDSAHAELKRRFLPDSIVSADGVLIAERIGSLTRIDKPRMSRLISDCIDWLGSEWGIVVPPPTTLERFGETETTRDVETGRLDVVSGTIK